MIASLKVCDWNNRFVVITKKPTMVCVCNYFCVSLQTAGYFMIASLNSVWLQLFKCVIAATRCGCNLTVWLQKMVHCDLKKAWTVCVCNYLLCVIATRRYVWLQPDCVCMVKTTWLFYYLWQQKSLNSVLLQQQDRSDCKKSLHSVCLQLFLCFIANYWLFYDCNSE
jgi:hypothetical protein